VTASLTDIGSLIVSIGFLIRCRGEMPDGGWTPWIDGILGVGGIVFFLFSQTKSWTPRGVMSKQLISDLEKHAHFPVPVYEARLMRDAAEAIRELRSALADYNPDHALLTEEPT
jgi:hypothetical protein